ncbi:hypothetical protein BXZ70DRAFT_191134 [Cristinia sonorae]|uniref:Uncharacterized protein n=1 Tax=Cristinia sonorae TaxID=1940300 RepID=A0A8K0UQD8_9AGAR|nr:hypothetical protein BXZ70DRAFT_191134 [Cristinia sonorae]
MSSSEHLEMQEENHHLMRWLAERSPDEKLRVYTALSAILVGNESGVSPWATGRTPRDLQAYYQQNKSRIDERMAQILKEKLGLGNNRGGGSVGGGPRKVIRTRTRKPRFVKPQAQLQFMHHCVDGVWHKEAILEPSSTIETNDASGVNNDPVGITGAEGGERLPEAVRGMLDIREEIYHTDDEFAAARQVVQIPRSRQGWIIQTVGGTRYLTPMRPMDFPAPCVTQSQRMAPTFHNPKDVDQNDSGGVRSGTGHGVYMFYDSKGYIIDYSDHELTACPQYNVTDLPRYLHPSRYQRPPSRPVPSVPADLKCKQCRVDHSIIPRGHYSGPSLSLTTRLPNSAKSPTVSVRVSRA